MDYYRVKYTDTSFIKAISELAHADIDRIIKSAVYEAAKFPQSVYRDTVPRDAGPGPHLADSIGIRCRMFKTGHGAYAVIGEKIVGGRTMVKNFHVQERGSTLRFRHKIGGKYRWMETDLPEAILKYKRATGMVVGQHWLRDIFIGQIPSMVSTIATQVKQKILVKWAGVPV